MYKDVVKMTSIEGKRCGVNGGQVRVANLRLIRCWIGSQCSEFRAEVVLVVERVTTQPRSFERAEDDEYWEKKGE